MERGVINMERRMGNLWKEKIVVFFGKLSKNLIY